MSFEHLYLKASVTARKGVCNISFCIQDRVHSRKRFATTSAVSREGVLARKREPIIPTAVFSELIHAT